MAELVSTDKLIGTLKALRDLQVSPSQNGNSVI
jgi:hypothetical protein